MAVSSLSSFFSTLLPSKSSGQVQRPTCLHCLPSQIHLPQSLSGWSSLVAAWDLTESSSSFSPRHASDYSPILNPVLAYSNILFFKSSCNVEVIVDENEPEDKLVYRFKKEVLKAGVLQECKRRRFFESQREKRKRKSREAAKKNRKRRPQSKFPKQNKGEVPKKKKEYDEKDDNWELPEGDLPYC